MFRVIPGERALPLGSKRGFQGILEGEREVRCAEVLVGRLRGDAKLCVCPLCPKGALLASISVFQGMGALLGGALLRSLQG